MKKKKRFNLGLVIGIMGAIAGIILILMGKYLIGISGSIASSALAFQSYNSAKEK